MDAEYGEVETSGNIAGKSFYDFRLLDAVAGADNDTFRYGEITVPVGFVYTYNDGKGFHVRIPYTPDMRRLTVRLVMESGSGGTEYLRNPATGKHWFPVVAETEAGTADIALAAFFSLNEKGVYNLLSRDGYLAVYSGSETDFEIGAAKAQNETFLLKASAGNLYNILRQVSASSTTCIRVWKTTVLPPNCRRNSCRTRSSSRMPIWILPRESCF